MDHNKPCICHDHDRPEWDCVVADPFTKRDLRVMLYAGVIALALLFAATIAGAEPMRASYYGSESGNRTASGSRFNPHGMTAAHKTLPFGTVLKVCYRGCVVVTINDRGPFVRGRHLDLSRGAAVAIGLTSVGVGTVQVERL